MKKPVDGEAIQILRERFNQSITDISEILGTSKQNIAKKLSLGNTKASWTQIDMTETEKQIIIEKLKHGQYESIEGEFKFRVLEYNNNICILINNNSIIKLILTIPIDIVSTIEEYETSISEIGKEIRENSRIEIVLGKKMLRPNDKHLKKRIKDRAKDKGIKVNEYVRMYGYDGVYDNRTVPDKEIISILQKYSDQNNNIKLAYRGEQRVEEYMYITRFAYNHNMTLNELINFFGFKKVK